MKNGKEEKLIADLLEWCRIWDGFAEVVLGEFSGKGFALRIVVDPYRWSLLQNPEEARAPIYTCA